MKYCIPTCVWRWIRLNVPKRRHKSDAGWNYPEESIQQILPCFKHAISWLSNGIHWGSATYESPVRLKSFLTPVTAFWFITPRILVVSWTLRMGPLFCPETSVGNYHYSLRIDPEERRSQVLRGGSLKSRFLERRCGQSDVRVNYICRLLDPCR